MPLFDKPDWPAYKAALQRIADTGSELEQAEITRAPGADVVEQQFHEAVLDYRQARAAVSDRPLPGSEDLTIDMDEDGTDWEAASRAAPGGRQGDGWDPSGRQQQG
jgi:hypothetical protein